MEGFLTGKDTLKLPPADGQDTIFEYLVNEQGEWEHWSERVSSLNSVDTLRCSLLKEMLPGLCMFKRLA